MSTPVSRTVVRAGLRRDSHRKVVALALAGWLGLMVLLMALTDPRMGFHRDELAFLDNARLLDWGYIEYPPLTSAVAALSLAAFGLSPFGLHLLSGLVVCATLALTAAMTLRMGGSLRAALVAMLSTATAPIVLFNNQFFSYQTFDYLWWVLAAYGLVALLQTDQRGWWLLIGAAIGLGVQTKYTTAFWAASLAIAVLLSPARKFLKSPWLWAGAGLAVLIALPNLIWQAQHNFISLRFLNEIHARDVSIGRADDFLLNQLFVNNNPGAIWLWAGGFWALARWPQFRAYRPLAWMGLIALVLFMATQSRFYYLAPAFPPLIAAGCVRVFGSRSDRDAQNPEAHPPHRWRLPQIENLAAVTVLGAVMALIMLPVAPVGSPLWKFAYQVNSEISEKVGWPELVADLTRIRDRLPAAQQESLGIITGNFGEAAAIDLYGPAYGLPPATSGVNSYWLRGYGSGPAHVLVIGFPTNELGRWFRGCKLAGRLTNSAGVQNEETEYHSDIYWCDGPHNPWPVMWPDFHWSG